MHFTISSSQRSTHSALLRAPFCDEKLKQVQSSRSRCLVGDGSGGGVLLPTHTPHISSVHPSRGTGNPPRPGPANSGENSVLRAQPVRPGGTPDPAHQLCQGIQVWDSRFTFCDLHEASEPRTRQMSLVPHSLGTRALCYITQPRTGGELEPNPGSLAPAPDCSSCCLSAVLGLSQPPFPPLDHGDNCPVQRA